MTMFKNSPSREVIQLSERSYSDLKLPTALGLF